MTTPRVGNLVLLGALIVSLIGCGRSENQNGGESSLERIRREGVVRIGYANEAPFGYQDTESGKVTGEAPEIAREVFKRMGIERVEATLTDFGQLIPGLKAGRYDVIAAGMYITPERCRQIAFSNPTYAIGEAFVVAKGNPLKLHSFADVRTKSTAKLGVVGGTVEVRIADEVGIPEERVVVFPDNAAALAGLRAGRIDAFAGTALTVQDLLRKAGDADFERAESFTQPSVGGRTRSYGAFGFRKEDTELVAAVNGKLADFIGSPEHRSLVGPFGFTEGELPGEVTAAQICGEESQ